MGKIFRKSGENGVFSHVMIGRKCGEKRSVIMGKRGGKRGEKRSAMECNIGKNIGENVVENMDENMEENIV